MAIVATAAGILLQGPYGAGLPLRDLFSRSVVGDVLQSRFGQLSLIRLVVLVVAGWLLRLILGADQRARPGLPRWWTPVAAITATVILLTVGLAAHAGAGQWVVLAIPFDFVHLAGVLHLGRSLALVVTGLLIRRAGNVGIPHHGIAVFSQLALLPSSRCCPYSATVTRLRRRHPLVAPQWSPTRCTSSA